MFRLRRVITFFNTIFFENRYRIVDFNTRSLYICLGIRGDMIRPFFIAFTFCASLSLSLCGVEIPDGMRSIIGCIGTEQNADSIAAISNPQKKLILADSSLRSSYASGNKKQIAVSLVRYGKGLFELDRFRESVDTLNKALHLLSAISDSTGIASVNHLIANNLLRLGDYFDALDYYDQALAIALEIKDSVITAKSYNGIGVLYFKLERYHDALNALQNALYLLERVDPASGFITKIENNIALCHLILKRYSKAKSCFFRTLRRMEANGDTLQMASVFDNLGRLYEETHRTDSAILYYRKALRIFSRYNRPHGIAVASLGLGHCYFFIDSLPKAHFYLSKAYRLSLLAHEPDLTMKVARKLACYYKRVGELSKSYEMLDTYTSLYEKLFSERNQKRVELLQQKLEMLRDEKNSALLQAKLKLEQLRVSQKNRFNRILLLFSVILTALLAFTFYLIVKLRARNRLYLDVNSQLLRFNDELEILVRSRTAELSNALDKVKELERIKSAFLANISHEIRTPLNGLVGFTDLILKGNLKPIEKENYSIQIRELGNRLIRIVDDILELSKIETNQLDLHYGECHVNRLLDEVFASLKGAKAIRKKLISFRVVKALPNNRSVIVTDTERLRRILFHLTENAIKFTKEGEIELGYTVESQSSIRFYVSDTGVGIPKNIQKRIFERFYKHTSDHSQIYYEGVGIGLTIAMGYALALGGKLTLTSKPNEGTIFFLTLPYAIPGDTKPQNFANYDLSGKEILVVEDDLVNYQYIEVLLKNTHAKLIHAKNAEDAIEICSINQKLNLVLLDIQLPFLSGLDAVRILRKRGIDVPVIAQTANSVSGDGRESIRAGCNAFISKPIDPDELLALIKKHIR